MARRKTRIERRIDEELLNENLPVDFLPFSNGEHFPEEASPELIAGMKLADEKTEEARRRFGVSRREFVRTGAAMWIGLWALNKVNPGKYGYYAFAEESGPHVSDDPLWDACALDSPGVQLANMDGEFIIDVQSHHVTNDEKWRVLLPVHHAFICGLFGTAEMQSHGGGFDPKKNNVDLCQNTGRWQYIKDLLLDSSTTLCVLSPIPAAPDEQQPLPFAEANATAEMVENLAGGTLRVVTHGYVMPNRGWFHAQNLGYVPGPVGGKPINPGTGVYTPGDPGPYPFLQDELDWMEERAIRYRKHLRGWKAYTPYGDVPFGSGMRHDDIAGMATNEQIRKLHDKYGVPKVFASHKGVWLPTFDDRAQACDDVPGAAIAYPDIRFVIYHSAGGWKGATYPTDTNQSDANIPKDDYTQGIIGLLKNLKDAKDPTTGNPKPWDATAHVPAGLSHGQSPNVYVDLGSVYPLGSADKESLFLGTMVKHLGSRRICWGTDCLWSGSPQPRIVALRLLQMTQTAKDLFNLPFGLDGDRFDPTKNALSGGSYTTSHPAEAIPGNPADVVGHWPTDGKAHPERSIRNGILGRNAADAYEIDVEEQRKLIDCDEVNRLRNEYISNRVNGLASIGPSRSNMIYGPRTKQETITAVNEDWKKNGWRA